MGNIKTSGNLTSTNTISNKFIFTGGGAQFSVSSNIISASASAYNFIIGSSAKATINSLATTFNTNVSVSGTVSVTSNIVSTNGNITNYEAATNLSSPLTYLYYSIDGSWGTITDSFSSGGITYTAKAYRVGALVHLSIVITRANSIQYNSSAGPFYGWTIRLSGQRFRPGSTITYGVGSGGFSGNGVYGAAAMSVFVNTTGLASYTDDFYVQFIPYIDSTGNNGGGYRSASRSNITFSGSITYVAGDATVGVGGGGGGSGI